MTATARSARRLRKARARRIALRGADAILFGLLTSRVPAAAHPFRYRVHQGETKALMTSDRRCGCGQPGTWALDPYALDMAGEENWGIWCDDCLAEMAADI